MRKITITTLFVALFASASLAQLDIVNNNVGIGTTNPLHRLDVAGYISSYGILSGDFYSWTGIFDTPCMHIPFSFRMRGVSAGFTGSNANSNVSFGFAALNNLSTGIGNTAIGVRALFGNTLGARNTAIGVNALGRNISGQNNIAVGYSALGNNTGTSGNIAVGNLALSSSTMGSGNVAVGNSALQSSIAGRFNIAVGSDALRNNTSSFNIAIGDNTLRDNTTGRGNVVIGDFAMTSLSSGSENIAIGISTTTTDNNMSNTIVIGSRVVATGSNQVRIGNFQATSVGGAVNWTTFSDERGKRNINADNVPGLDFINRLQPVTYNINLDAVDALMSIDNIEAVETFALEQLSDCLSEKERRQIRAERERLHSEFSEQERIAREIRQNQLQTGFLAQNVRAAAESIGFDFSGVDVDEMGIYGLRYAEFVVPLVRAVQELSQMIDQLQVQNEELRSEVRALQRGGIIGIPAPPPIQTMSAPAPTSNNDWNPFDEDTGREATLFQNAPNPFRQATEIRFYLPQTVNTAFLIFYDLQGRQLHQITLTQRGAGAELIQGSQFAPGIYLYALIADGQAVAVKQMIITE